MGTHALPQMLVLSPIVSLTRLMIHTDCVQVLHRRYRNTEVRTLVFSYFPHLRIHPRFGWFWECPNGGEKCQYRHALPPGFVLKSQRKAIEEAEKANTISLEEFLEVEVHI